MLTPPDFNLGDLGAVLDRLEAMAPPALVALTAPLEAHDAAAVLVLRSERSAVEHLCGALPGVDGPTAASWLLDLARHVFGITVKLPDVAATESEAGPTDATPGLVVTDEVAAIGLPSWLLELVEAAALTLGRRLILATVAADVVHGLWDERSGVIGLVPGLRPPRGYPSVLAHELGHVADHRFKSPDREWFAETVAAFIMRARPTSWAEVVRVADRFEALRPPLPTLAEANDALVDRYWSTLWFLYEARRWRPNPFQQEVIAA